MRFFSFHDGFYLCIDYNISTGDSTLNKGLEDFFEGPIFDSVSFGLNLAPESQPAVKDNNSYLEQRNE